MDPPCSASHGGATIRVSGPEEDNPTSTETGNNSFHTFRLVSFLSHTKAVIFLGGPQCGDMCCDTVFDVHVCAVRTPLGRKPPTTTQQQFKHYSLPSTQKSPGQQWKTSHLKPFINFNSCSYLFNPVLGIWQTKFCALISDWLSFYHHLSSGTATTGPSNWPHKHCQSNCHGKRRKYCWWLSEHHYHHAIS